MADTKTNKKRFSALKAEFAKIFWPDRNTVTKQTIAVIIVSAIMGVLIVFFDMFIQFGLDKLFAL